MVRTALSMVQDLCSSQLNGDWNKADCQLWGPGRGKSSLLEAKPQILCKCWTIVRVQVYFLEQ